MVATGAIMMALPWGRHHYVVTTGVGGAGGAAGTTGAAGSAGGVAGSAAGTSGAAGAAGSGASGNCGNGVIDPGEQCDGAALDNATCTLLGFSGGSLSCSSSCEFNVSSCTGAAITPTIVSSRTSCAAPCAIFFDASSTAGLFGTAPTPAGGTFSGDYVGANWDWDFGDPTSLHKSTIGFAVAHVFDSPGTYSVKVVVHDLAGNAGFATQTITVSAMSGTTYYVATSGSDGLGGTTPATAFATIAHALSVGGATNNSILLRRGDTFSLSSTTTLSETGPFLWGAYVDPLHVSATVPEVDITISGGTFANAFLLSSSTDIRVTDIFFSYTYLTGTPGNVFNLVSAVNSLFERVEATFNSNGGTVWNADSASTKFTVADSNLHGFNGYGYFGASPQFAAFVGVLMTGYTTNNHAIRFQGGTTGTPPDTEATNEYVADSTFLPDPSITGGFGDVTFRGDNTNSVFVNNYISAIGTALDWEPQNTSSVEHVINALCEGNTIIVPQNDPFKFTAQHVYVRNNLLIGMDMGIDVIGDVQMPAGWTTDVNIYNNTQYNPAVIGSNVYFVRQIGTTGNVVVTNNILYTASSSTDSAVTVSWDSLGTITPSHNLIFSSRTGIFTAPGVGTGGVVAQDPKFVSNGVDFRLQATSPAVDTGLTTGIVFESFNPSIAPVSPLVSMRGSYRPQNTTRDIGLAERKNP